MAPRSKGKPGRKPQTAMPVIIDEADAILAMLGRMLADPDTPLSRIEHMEAIYRGAVERKARIAFDVAMADMQPKLPVIGRDATGEKGYKFAKWEEVAAKIVPILSEHGFSLRHQVEDMPFAGEIKITAILAHNGGHREMTGMPFPFDYSDGKNEFHARGSAISYGKRYVSGVILNIITRGEDDDAQAAGKTADAAAPSTKTSARETISDDQVDELRTMLSGRDTARFMVLASRECRRTLDSLSDIPSEKFETIKGLLTVHQGAAA